MNVNQQRDGQGTSNNALMFTATIFAAPTMSQSSDLSMQQSRQSNDSNSQALMSDLNPFLSGSIDITQQTPSVEQLMSPSAEDESKDTYKGKFSRMSQWKAQLPKREPHNYDKCQPTAHQTTIYNQILAQQQETPTVTAAPIFNSNPYMTEAAASNMNMNMSTNQTTTNNYNNSTCGGPNALNLSNNQMYANKMMMNIQPQVR